MGPQFPIERPRHDNRRRPPWARRLLGVPAWLLAVIVVSLMVGLAFVPSPKRDRLNVEMRFIVARDDGGRLVVTDQSKGEELMRDGKPQVAHGQFQFIRQYQWDLRSVPTHTYDWSWTIIWTSGERDPIQVSASDEIWPLIRTYILAKCPELASRAIQPCGRQPDQVWWPGMRYNALLFLRRALWIALVVPTLRFLIPLPFNSASRRLAAGLCPACAYPMAASGSTICPECGTLAGADVRRAAARLWILTLFGVLFITAAMSIALSLLGVGRGHVSNGQIDLVYGRPLNGADLQLWVGLLGVLGSFGMAAAACVFRTWITKRWCVAAIGIATAWMTLELLAGFAFQ